MAETLGGLYIRLGLSLSDLESDFIAAEKTIAQNMANLSRESNLISLRAEVDIGNLDPAIDAVQILTIREQALNEQLQIQSDKIKLAAAAVQDLTQKHGASAAITQKAEASLKREELTLQRLQRELQGVKDAQQQLNSQQPKGNFLTAAYGALKGNMPEQLSGLVNSFDKLKSVTGAADGAITKALETIGNIPTPVTVAVAALAALPVALKKIEDGILDLAKPAIESGDAFYVWSRGLQMSIAEAEELSMVCKVTGIEVSEVTSAMRRLDMQLVKSTGNDALSQMLQRYAVETRNANGEMKNALELSQAIAQGLSKAQAEGRGKDFISTVLGRSASGDLVTYFEDLAGNIEFAKSVVRNGLFDPTQAHAIQGNINAMNAQAEQLGGAFSSALMPVANEIVPKITERMGELTKVIADNADGIKNIGFAVGEVAGYVSDFATEIVKLGAQSTKWVKAPTSAIVDKYKDDPTINSIHDLVAKELDANHSEAEKFVIQSSERLYAAEVKRLEPAYKEIKEYKDKINEELKEIAKSWADFQRETDIFTDQTESLERVKKILEEIEKIKIDLKFGSDTYGKSLAELDFWYRSEFEKAEGFELERAKITELYAAKREQIERDNAEKIAKEREESEKRIQELVQSAADIEYAATHSAIEKQIRDIELWKQAQLDKAKTVEESVAISVNAITREREAFERELDRIKGKTQDLHEKIFAQEHSQRDVDVLRAQKERAQLYQEGIYDSDTIERWYNNELGKIAERATESFRMNQGAYSQAPRRRGGNEGFQLIASGEVTGGAPITPPDFYGEIQAQTDKAMERFGVLADSTQAVTDAQSNFVDVFARESERFAQVMQELSEKLSGSQITADNQIAAANQPAEDPLLNSTNAKTFFNILANGGEIAALAGLATANPALGLGGAGVAAVGNVGSTALEALEDYGKNQPELPTAPSADLSEFNSLIQGFQDEMSRLIGDLYETTKGIAENVNIISSQPPNITVSPTINVELGGAYVFDNAMKQKLTDDITDKVADAVKSAVENGISQSSYGYGS